MGKLFTISILAGFCIVSLALAQQLQPTTDEKRLESIERRVRDVEAELRANRNRLDTQIDSIWKVSEASIEAIKTSSSQSTEAARISSVNAAAAASAAMSTIQTVITVVAGVLTLLAFFLGWLGFRELGRVQELVKQLMEKEIDKAGKRIEEKSNTLIEQGRARIEGEASALVAEGKKAIGGELANAQAQLKDLAGTNEKLKKVIEIDDLLWLGTKFFDLYQISYSLEAADKVVQGAITNRHVFQGRLLRAACLKRQGKYGEALEAAKEALRDDERPAQGWYNSACYASLVAASKTGEERDAMTRQALELLRNAKERSENYVRRNALGRKPEQMDLGVRLGVGPDPDLDIIRELPEFRALFGLNGTT